MSEALQATIEQAWEARDEIGRSNDNGLAEGRVREAVEAALAALDSGEARVAEKRPDGWHVNQWLKKAVLLSFRLTPMELIDGGPGGAPWWDKVPSKFLGWDAGRFGEAGFRAVPGSIVRRGAFIGKGAVLMPSFVNIGAYVDEGTMVDTWATVGSCAQIGKNVHISGGAGIGGVLEPPQAAPVIVEDGAFIGSRCIVVEGVRVGAEAVLGANAVLTASTTIIDVTGDAPVESRGYVPPRSVVIPGTRPKRFPAGEYGVPCALIIGRRSESTDRKTSLNQALRDHDVAV